MVKPQDYHVAQLENAVEISRTDLDALTPDQYVRLQERLREFIYGSEFGATKQAMILHFPAEKFREVFLRTMRGEREMIPDELLRPTVENIKKTIEGIANAPGGFSIVAKIGRRPSPFIGREQLRRRSSRRVALIGKMEGTEKLSLLFSPSRSPASRQAAFAIARAATKSLLLRVMRAPIAPANCSKSCAQYVATKNYRKNKAANKVSTAVKGKKREQMIRDWNQEQGRLKEQQKGKGKSGENKRAQRRGESEMEKQSFEAVEKHLYKRQYQTAHGRLVNALLCDFHLLGFQAPHVQGGRDVSQCPRRTRQLPHARQGAIQLRCGEARATGGKGQADVARRMARQVPRPESRETFLENPQSGSRDTQTAHGKYSGRRSESREDTWLKTRRMAENVIRHGKKVERKKISGATCNREVSCLIAALNLARDQGLCEDAPSIKKERETPRERILTDAEFRALLAASPAWLRRVLVAARETGFDRGVLLDLTWDCVLPGLVIVKGGRAKTGARQRGRYLPRPRRSARTNFASEYRAHAAYRKKSVSPPEGRPIPHTTLRHAVEKAVKDAGIEDFQFRDFRHCARTRWAAMGLPFEVAEIGLGHKLRGIAGRYVNLSDEQIRAAFQEMLHEDSCNKPRTKTQAG